MKKIKSIKLSINSLEKANGVIIAPVPNIKNEFNIHEPIKFPTAKFPSFLITAIIDVTNSGKAVPIATIVNPITLSEIPYFIAISVVSFTTTFPPLFNAIIPTIIKSIDNSVPSALICFFLFSLIDILISFISITIGYKKYNKYNATKIIPSVLFIRLFGLPNIPNPKDNTTIVENNATGKWINLVSLSITMGLKEVPKATIVKPIKISGILNFLAILLEPLTSKSARIINNKKLVSTSIIVSFFFFFGYAQI